MALARIQDICKAHHVALCYLFGSQKRERGGPPQGIEDRLGFIIRSMEKLRCLSGNNSPIAVRFFDPATRPFKEAGALGRVTGIFRTFEVLLKKSGWKLSII